MPYKTGIRLLGVARNPANGFPARLLVGRSYSDGERRESRISAAKSIWSSVVVKGGTEPEHRPPAPQAEDQALGGLHANSAPWTRFGSGVPLCPRRRAPWAAADHSSAVDLSGKPGAAHLPCTAGPPGGQARRRGTVRPSGAGTWTAASPAPVLSLWPNTIWAGWHPILLAREPPGLQKDAGSRGPAGWCRFPSMLLWLEDTATQRTGSPFQTERRRLERATLASWTQLLGERRGPEYRQPSPFGPRWS